MGQTMDALKSHKQFCLIYHEDEIGLYWTYDSGTKNVLIVNDS
jgi:hypothetical protein